MRRKDVKTMTIQELIQEAQAAGFTQVNDGVDTWELDNFAEAMADDEGDYALHYNGNVYRYNSQGFEESAHCLKFSKSGE